MFNQRRQYQSRELQVLDSIFQNLEKLYTLLIKVEPENLILDSGTATLTAGTVTVNTPNIKTGYKIYVSYDIINGTPGSIYASSSDIIDETSFIINSTSVTDTSTINWYIKI